MGRGGAGSSGGRSSGGGSRGGSRSSGGHRNSASRGGSSFSGRGGSLFRTPPPGTAYRTPGRRYMPPPPPGPYPPRGSYYRPRRHDGCLTAVTGCILVMIIIFLLFPRFLPVGNSSDWSLTKSTVEREPLPASEVITTDYYEDTIGWIESGSRLEKGMKEFFSKTGVQPYLYLTETVNGSPRPSDAEMESFANSLYDELFQDEGHLLVVFQEYNSDSNYFVWCIAGRQAKTVFDNEARDIFYDYIDHYYVSDLDTSDYFSTVFEKTADRMMQVTPNPLVKIVAYIVIFAVILLAFLWWKKAKEQKNREAEQTERILNADLGESFTDPKIKDLEEKYK